MSTKDSTGAERQAEEVLDPLEIGRAASGRPVRDDRQRSKKARPAARRPDRGRYPERKPKVVAPHKPSMSAEKWVAAGAALGWDFPFDANWLAHKFANRMARDERMRILTAAGREDDAFRLLDKMIEVWWRDYVNGEVTHRNAVDFFLIHDWEDLEYFAYTSLRARYLKEHGKPRRPLEQDPDKVQKYQEELSTLRENQRLSEYVHNLPDEVPEVRRLDENDRQRLRSWAENRRNQRRKK